ncbi:MAG: hypothetical protein WC683_06835 [bacterium]
MGISKDRDAICTGWRLRGMGLESDALSDWMEIHRLNERITSLWTANNNSKGRWPQDMYARNEAAQGRGCVKAKALADKHHWKIDMSGGLWWTVYNRKGEALR